jgi:hypothetical protein
MGEGGAGSRGEGPLRGQGIKKNNWKGDPCYAGEVPVA